MIAYNRYHSEVSLEMKFKAMDILESIEKNNLIK